MYYNILCLCTMPLNSNIDIGISNIKFQHVCFVHEFQTVLDVKNMVLLLLWYVLGAWWRAFRRQGLGENRWELWQVVFLWYKNHDCKIFYKVTQGDPFHM